MLHALRRIRGTKVDVFGYHHIRRMEREPIAEYRDTVDSLLSDLTRDHRRGRRNRRPARHGAWLRASQGHQRRGVSPEPGSDLLAAYPNANTPASLVS